MPRFRVQVIISDNIEITAEAETAEEAGSMVSQMGIEEIIAKGRSKGCSVETKIGEIEEMS